VSDSSDLKKEVLEKLKKEDPKLAELLEIELIKKREFDNKQLEDALKDLEKYDYKFAKLFGKGLFWFYKFEYKNPNFKIKDLFETLVFSFLKDEMEMEGKALTQDLQIMLAAADVFAAFNNRAQSIFFKTAMEYSQQIIQHIKYLSELIKEIEIWERISRLYELFKKSKDCDALSEIKSYWLNNKNPQLFQYKQYGFHGIIDSFHFCWEKDVAEFLLSDNIKERQRAIDWITAKVWFRTSKDYAILKGKESLLEEVKELEEILKLEESNKGSKEKIEEIKKKLEETREKLKNLEKTLEKDGKIGFNYFANTNILIQALRQFYDWFYTNYKVIKMSYLAYRSLIRMNLFNLYQYVKAARWNLKMYEIARIKENLNPFNFEFYDKSVFKFTYLADKDFNDDFKLVLFIDVEISGKVALDQRQNLILGEDFNIKLYYSLLTEEELDLLKSLELSKELEELGLIEKEFLENFLEEIRRFVVGDYFYKLEEFYKNKKYKKEDLINLLEQKDKVLAEKVKKVIEDVEKNEEKKEKEDKKKEKGIIEILKEFVVYITLLFTEPKKLFEFLFSNEKEKEKKEKKEEKKDLEKERDKLIDKGVFSKMDEEIRNLILKSESKLKECFKVKEYFIYEKWKDL